MGWLPWCGWLEPPHGMVTLMWLVRATPWEGHPDVAGQSHPRRPYSPHVMTPLMWWSSDVAGHPDVAGQSHPRRPYCYYPPHHIPDIVCHKGGMSRAPPQNISSGPEEQIQRPKYHINHTLFWGKISYKSEHSGGSDFGIGTTENAGDLSQLNI